MRVVDVCRRCPDFMEDGGVCRCLRRAPAVSFSDSRAAEWISVTGYRRKRIPTGCRFREEMFQEWCARNPEEALPLRMIKAVRRDDLVQAESLIAEGVDPSRVVTGEGRNLLFDYIYAHWKFNARSAETIRFLLRSGVSPCGKERSGKTLRALLDDVICADFKDEVAEALAAAGCR